MPTIPLTHGKVATVDEADYDRVRQHKWYASLHHSGVWQVHGGWSVNRILLQRFVMGLHVGSPEYVICLDDDHLHCTNNNLRVVSAQVAVSRKKKRGDRTSQYKGCYWNARRRMWHAQILVDGKRTHLGYWDSEEDAARSYDRACYAARGDAARLNFPGDEMTRMTAADK